MGHGDEAKVASVSEFDPPRPWTSSYAEGVPEEVPPITGSLIDFLEESARTYRDAPALEFFGRTITYRRLLDQVERVAGALADRGVGAGTRVALVLPNCPQHVVAFYAVQRLGGVVIEHNPLYTIDELEHQFADHRAQHAIAWDSVAPSLQQLSAELRPGTLVAVDLTTAMPVRTQLALRLPVRRAREARRALHEPAPGCIAWESLLRAQPVATSVPRPATEDLAVIQYTSGTTGRAKGVELSHRNLMANARQCIAYVPDLPRGDGCVVHGVLPMFHAYGLTLCQTISVLLGARLVLFAKFDPSLMLPVIQRRPPTLLPLVPPMAERLVHAAQQSTASLRGIRYAISGAMPLRPELIAAFEAATGGYLLEGYGLSECAPILMVNPLSDARRTGTIGLPVPSTEVRLVDPDHPTQDVAPGERGEIVVRGPQVFRGYIGMPEETAEAFVDGWFRTGDIATMDGDGFFRIVDRVKELIITGGFNVMPSEVENALREHPDVADAAVVGLPNAHSGEEVVAAVVPAPGHTIDPQELRHFARERLTPYKVPRRVFVLTALPTSMIGKVVRREVRDEILRQLNG